MIVAEPPPTAVTKPFSSTVTAFGLLLVQTIFEYASLVWEIVACSCIVPPSDSDALRLFSLIEMPLTEMVQVLFLPLAVRAVMVALPPPTAVARPFSSTVTAAGLLEDQITAASSALAGDTFADSCTEPPSDSDALRLFSFTLLTASGETVTTQVLYMPLLAIAVMTAVPAFMAVTLPEADTAATSGLEDSQMTLRSAALDGLSVAFS